MPVYKLKCLLSGPESGEKKHLTMIMKNGVRVGKSLGLKPKPMAYPMQCPFWGRWRFTKAISSAVGETISRVQIRLSFLLVYQWIDRIMENSQNSDTWITSSTAHGQSNTAQPHLVTKELRLRGS